MKRLLGICLTFCCALVLLTSFGCGFLPESKTDSAPPPDGTAPATVPVENGDAADDAPAPNDG